MPCLQVKHHHHDVHSSLARAHERASRQENPMFSRILILRSNMEQESTYGAPVDIAGLNSEAQSLEGTTALR